MKIPLHLTLKKPNTKIDNFSNTIHQGETAYNEKSHLDLQCLPYSL